MVPIIHVIDRMSIPFSDLFPLGFGPCPVTKVNDSNRETFTTFFIKGFYTGINSAYAVIGSRIYKE